MPYSRGGGGDGIALKKQTNKVRALPGILFHFSFIFSNIYDAVFRYAIFIQTFIKVLNLLGSFLSHFAVCTEGGVKSKELRWCSVFSIAPGTSHDAVREW